MSTLALKPLHEEVLERMLNFFSQLARFSEQAIARASLRSALNPVILLMLITTPIGAIGAYMTLGFLQIVSIILALTGPSLFVFAFVYFMFKHPQMLRSEQYDLKRMALGVIEQKGERFPISDTSVEAIANLEYKGEKPKGEGEEEQ